MLKIRALFLFLMGVVFSNVLQATHLLGGEITYEHVSNDSLRVEVKLYRDCNSTVPFNLLGRVRTGCSFRTFTLTQVKVNDITGIPFSCSTKSRCSGTYPYGIEEYIFTGGFKLLNDTCCNYIISVMQCCRSTTITTGSDNSNLYLEASFNKCLAPKNFSPKFINTPTFLAEVGDFKNITATVLDTVDNDSLSYELVNPYKDEGLWVGYSNAYSPLKPLTFLGFSNANLPSPQGFHFDEGVGDFEFTPVRINQITVIALKIKEWRKINGVTQQVGETMREFQLTMIRDTANKPPVFTRNERELSICGDTGKYYFQIPIVDSNSSDYVHLNYYTNIKNITFTEARNKSSEPTVEVCVTVDSAMLKKMALQQFTIIATDSACNLPGKAEKTYYFKFYKKILPDSFSINISLSDCRKITAGLINNSSLNSVNTFWELRNAKDTTTKAGDTLFINQATDTGWHYITVNINSELYCEGRTIKDSIYIDKERFFRVSLGADKAYCFKNDDTLQLSDTLVFGKAPYSYKWSINNSDTNTIVITSLDTGENKFWVEVVDANQCLSTDTVIIGSYAPKVILNYLSKVCYKEPFTVSAMLEGAYSSQFEWAGFPKNQLSFNDILFDTGSYRFLLTDTFGCKIDTTINISIWNPSIEIVDVSQCNNDTVILTSVNFNAKQPITYNWLTIMPLVLDTGFSVGKDTLFVYPTHNKDSLMIFLYAADSNGCFMGDTIIVDTKNAPQSVIPDFVASKTIGVVGDTIWFTNLTPNSSSIINKWDFGDFGKPGNIAVIENPKYTYTDTGRYTVKLWVKNAACPADSVIKTDYITITNTVSVKKLNINTLKLYPNPAKDKLTVEIGEDIASIIITGALGRKIKVNSTINNSKAEINVDALPADIYFIEAKDITGKIYTGKVQVSR